MTDHRFDENDEVLVIGDHSDFKGQWGRVIQYEATFDRYFVFLPDVHKVGYYSAFEESELEFLEPLEDVDDEDPEGLVIDVPKFPMTAESFAAHVELLLGQTLSRVGTIGPEQVFFGFQAFEGKSTQEILIDILGKVEEVMIMGAQLHILVARIGVALGQVNPGESQ